MPLSELGLELRRLAAPVPIWHGRVGRDAWSAAARSIADTGGRLVSVWGLARGAFHDEVAACAAYAIPEGLVWLELKLDDATPGFPDLALAFPCAVRMQRAMADLTGIQAEGSGDDRPWLDHGVWSPGPPPLRRTAESEWAAGRALPTDYSFVRVDGNGVHEIAVGPVHAGIIEPGHFRFSVVGEKVLRLEQHLGYTHKGIERRFTELMPLEGARLAGRVSGDTTVAYAWAYSMALESAWGAEIPARATWLRALMLERERVSNHLGDLGALGNDAALAFGLAQFSRLREDWLRLSREVFGHRLMMDAIVPGGVAIDLTPAMRDHVCMQCDVIEREVRALRRIYDEHAGLQDRFVGTGQVTPQLAAQLGLTGLAGRASGQMADLRCDFPWPPYDQLKVAMATHRDGDVAARVTVRFEEVFESLRLIRAICSGLPDGAARAEMRPQASASLGAGWVESWRGEVLVALEIGGDGRIVRCHCHDPSWQNWPVLEHAIIGNIVPDFPLINKSFNLSYSGHDL
jgi:Ni,Fe-hydrogenase III large subunit/Ni,Fe-hydrogenase III component G